MNSPEAPARKRWARSAYWMVPPLVCLAVYWYGLKAWFQQDDFAWLGLGRDIGAGLSPWEALFAPMAQGTIRPWSERLFFLVFHGLFGMDPLPFRVWVFLTQWANLALVMSIGARITGSRAAGLLAALLWTMNAGLARPMSWTSAYNQILCGFFVLLAFHLLLRHIETGARKYWLWQWVVYLAGFGALELNVVYPALAASYALCCARPLLRKTLPLFVPAIAFAAAHRLAAPGPATGPYAMHFDARIGLTLFEYLRNAFGPWLFQTVLSGPFWLGLAWFGTFALGAALAAFLAARLAARDWRALFLAGWFPILLGPVLPLRDHITEYYLTLPTIGLAMLAGWGMGNAWRRGGSARALAAAAGVLYLATSLPATLKITRMHHDRSKTVRELVWSVVRARQLHPRELILLANVDTDLFWTAIIDNPFRLYDVKDVYLAPGSEGNIQAFPELGRVSDFVLPTKTAMKALNHYQAVVYSVRGGHLRNVTSQFLILAEARGDPDYARRVDVAEPVCADLLDKSWYAAEEGFRWMPKRAGLRMAAPRSPAERLYVTGYAPDVLFAQGPVKVAVTAGGRALPPATLSQGGPFDLAFDLPGELGKSAEMPVTIEVDRTFVLPPDERELSLRLGTFAVR